LTDPSGINQLAFWLSIILIVGCLLLCLQKQRRVVPFIRKVGPWGWAVPPLALLLTAILVAFFGLPVPYDSVVIVFALVFAIATVFYFLVRLGV
jgi:hypothetical protein